MIKTDRPVSKESDSLGLRFESHDDALNYVDKLVKDANDHLAANNLNIAKNYRRGELVIQLKLNGVSSWGSKQYHLVFAAIPSRRPRKLKRTSSFVLATEARALAQRYYGSNDSVFIGVTDVVQGPKSLIPSFVWSGFANQTSDFMRDMFPHTFHGCLKLRFGVADRKVINRMRRGTDSVYGLVERGAEVTDCINGVPEKITRQGLSKSQLKKIVATLRISLGESGVSVIWIKENIDLPIKFGEVVIARPSDTVL